MERVKPKLVIDYLNEIDYSDDPNYRPSEFALKMMNFIKMVNGPEGEENKTPVVHLKMLDKAASGGSDVLNMCHRGVAKALSVDTKIPTTEGLVDMGDLAEGAFIYGEDGNPYRVINKSKVFYKTMYRLTVEDGRTLDVSEDHINTVLHRRQKRVKGKRVNYIDRRDLTTKELLDIPLTASRNKTPKNPKGNENKVWLPLTKPVNYCEKEFDIDPYTLGVALGDGAMCRVSGFCRIHGHINDLPEILSNIPYESGEILLDSRNSSLVRASLKGLGSSFKALGLNCHGDDKFIPEEYQFGSIRQRLDLIQGLMDTDGTVYKNGACAFTNNSLLLVQGLQRLIWSVGGIASYSKTGKAYRLNIQCNQPLFKLTRKLDRQSFKSKEKVALVSIERIDDCPSQCIRVGSPEATFLAGDYLVTHNTTVLGEYLFLYLAVFGELDNFGSVDLAIYVSDSIENGVKNMRKNLEFRWENSDFLQQAIPVAKFTDIRWEFKNAEDKTLIIKGYGGKTGVRGAKELGKRPQLAVLDDLISDDDARSPTVIASIEDTIYKAIDYALHPTRRKIIWSGTPFNAKDPLYKAVESGAWEVNVYPVCEKFPCTEEEFRGSWPDRFNYAYVKKQYDKAVMSGKADTFNQELMLRIMSDDDRLILDGDIGWYRRNAVIENKSAYNFYITTDFATSEKQSADFSVISVWAYNNNGDWLWVDGVCARQLMDANLDELFRLVQEYQPISVGVEVSGQQGGFVSLIKRRMEDTGIWFKLASDNNSNREGIRPNGNKFTRFNTMVPLFKNHKIMFPEELRNSAAMVQAMDELTLLSIHGFKSKHDDFSDTISMLSVMKPFKPSVSPQLSQESSGSNVYYYEQPDSMTNYRLNSYIV